MVLPNQAVILAGGFGTRLRSVVQDVPKPMATINGQPFLCYVLDYCLQYGINHVILAVGYKHEVIKDFFGYQYKGITLSYSVEEEPLGTGGAIRQAMASFGDGNDQTPIYVLNGDTLFAADLRQLYDLFVENKADIALALRSLQNFDRYGIVETDAEGRVKAFCEKRFCRQGNINGGVYILSPTLLRNFPMKFSFEKNVLEAFVLQYRLYGRASDAYFIDIGIPEDYYRAINELKSVGK